MGQDERRASLGSRIAIDLVFGILGLSFIVETAVMIWEFRAPLALPMLAFDSQTFLFFPTLGLIGLLAFRRAAMVLLDAHWRFIKGGMLSLLVGLLFIGAIAGYLTYTFQTSPNRLWWEIAKPTLLADQGEPAGCTPPGCDRAPIVEAHRTVRLLARSEAGLSSFVESCEDESMSRFRPQEDRENFCFVTGATMSVQACCEAKEGFKNAVTALSTQAPSLTSKVHQYVLPFKAFFLLLLLMIGLMLARSRTVLEQHYPAAMIQVERNIPIGGLSMLLWPLMNQAYTQSFDLLYGSGDSGAFRVTAPLYTVAFAAWVGVLLFYYFRRYPKETEGAAKVIGGLLAGLSILNFNVILAGVNRFLGAGTNVVSIAILAVISLFLAWELMLNAQMRKSAAASALANDDATDAAADIISAAMDG